MNNSEPIIDCDIHPFESESCPLEPFIPPDLKLALEQHQASAPSHGYVNPFGVRRRDVDTCDSPVVKEQVFERYGVSFGVLVSPGLSVSMYHSIPVANGMAEAYNNWTIERFLNDDARFLGSVSINVADPVTAAAEIRRAGAHKQMVQVCVVGESELLYGHPVFDPIYEACVEMGLVFALHPGPEGAITPSTPVGRPRSYAEWHSGIPLTFQAQLINMVMEGVFERYPELMLMLIEGGFGWLPHVMWRMDKNFKALRTTLPWLKRLPSEYVRDHVRLTTQPLEEPAKVSDLLNMFTMIQADQTLCFSSDFPHWDMDDPYRAFPRGIDASIRRRIFHDNAADLYGLEIPQRKAEAAHAT